MADGDGVQPDEGQGAAPYQEYLDRIPEELREQVEPVFRDWDAGTTRKFQEAAEYRSRMQPYEQAGITNHSPDVLQWGANFYDAVQQNPAAVQEWFNDYAQEHGLSVKQQEKLADDLGLGDELETSDISKALEQHLGPISQQLGEINQWRQAQEQQVALQAATQMVTEQMADIKEKHPDIYDEAAIEPFIGKYIEQDPMNAVARGFADYEAVYNQITKKALQGKVNTSGAAPEGGGYADGAPEEIKTLGDANRIALERMRGNRAA